MGSLKHIENCSVFAVFSLIVELNRSSSSSSSSSSLQHFCPPFLSDVVADSGAELPPFHNVSSDLLRCLAFTRVIFRKVLGSSKATSLSNEACFSCNMFSCSIQGIQAHCMQIFSRHFQLQPLPWPLGPFLCTQSSIFDPSQRRPVNR